MRNATCAETQTSKVPTRVTLLFIPYTVLMALIWGSTFKGRCLPPPLPLPVSLKFLGNDGKCQAHQWTKFIPINSSNTLYIAIHDQNFDQIMNSKHFRYTHICSQHTTFYSDLDILKTGFSNNSGGDRPIRWPRLC